MTAEGEIRSNLGPLFNIVAEYCSDSPAFRIFLRSFEQAPRPGSREGLFHGRP